MKTKNLKHHFLLSSLLLSLFMSIPAEAASDAILSLGASPASIAVNGTSTISVRLNAGSNTTITTVQSYMTFDPEYLQVVGDVSTGSSAFPLSFRNIVNNTTGRIELSLSNTTPQGGSSLAIATYTVRGIKAGTSMIRFDQNNAAVLLNDRDNTNVLASSNQVTITIGNSGNSNTNSCVDTAWSPDASGNCSTTTVTQTSNCGRTRSVSGSRNCSGGGGGGGGATASHNDCVNNMCIRVAGVGADSCQTGSSCTSSSSSSGGSPNGSSGGSSSGVGGDLDPRCTLPQNVVATGGKGTVQLTWNNNDSRVTAYDVFIGQKPGESGRTEHVSLLNSLMVTGLAEGKTYYITMSAMGECLASDKTSEMTVKTEVGSRAAATTSKKSGVYSKKAMLPKKTSQSGPEVIIPFLGSLIGAGLFMRKKKV